MTKYTVTTRLVENVRSVAENGRGHSLVMGLPVAKGGSDKGPTALEVALIGLAGCVVTIYADIAKRSKVPISKLEAEVVGGTSKSPTAISLKINVQGKASKNMLETIFRKTEEHCPVIHIFKEETPVKVQLEVISE